MNGSMLYSRKENRVSRKTRTSLLPIKKRGVEMTVRGRTLPSAQLQEAEIGGGAPRKLVPFRGKGRYCP